jgi:hypothetical protein
MFLASSVLVLSLLQQIEEASHAEPPIFQVETLLSTARLLRPETYPNQRRAFIESALRINAAIRDEPSRITIKTNAAHLLAVQDRAEARRLCREIPVREAVRCWILVDPLEGLGAMAFPQDHTADEAKFLLSASEILAAADTARAMELMEKLAKRIAKKPPIKPKRTEVNPAIKRRMDRADRDDISDIERSLLFREVLDESDTIEDITERLIHQGAIAVWFAANREEATASLTAAKLHRTFADACKCEDAQCDSIEGRADCSSNIDSFVWYLAEQKVDPTALRIRHPSLAAHALVHKLKEALP